MAERKTGRIRRTPSLDAENKQIDQPLRNAEEKAAIGKIAGPRRGQRTNQTAAEAKQENATMANRTEKSVKKSPASGASKPKRQQGGSRKAVTSGKGKADSAKDNAPRKTAKASGGEKKQPRQTATKHTANAAQKKNEPVRVQRGKKQKKPSIKAYFLGGLNEIGKNFTVFECNDDMIIVDCGMAFPNDDMLGIDIVIPDFTFVEKNASKIKGIVITHGHEDHIGSVPYLLRKLKVPIYATALTIGLIKNKLKEHNLLSSAKLQVSPAGSMLKLGCMQVELVHVNHSIADAVAVVIHSPAGVVIHTGDFKIDCTPTEGEMINLGRFAELGNQGVLAMMADSTNVERPGYTQTEQMVNNSLFALFAKAGKKRIIIATFASNISRVQQIINCAEQYGRKVALSGRSMLNVMGIATELGYLHVPEGLLIDLNMINRYENEQVVLVTTGSQGEPMSALTRMAFADHRQVEVGEDDFIILSARPIPGNEKTVGAVVNELMRKNCTVIYESIYDVHVSGHACQEELKILQALCKPKYFIPVHGEQKHLRKHAELSMSLGMSKSNIFIGDIGNSVEINEAFMRKGSDVPAGSVMVDGLGVGDIGSVVLRDRKHLAEDGIIIAVCTIDKASGEIVSGPDIVSRGFVYVRESEKLMDEARVLVYNTFKACASEGIHDWTGMKQSVRDELSRFLYRKTQRSPMILPIIMEA